jgi:hypothetical protein
VKLSHHAPLACLLVACSAACSSPLDDGVQGPDVLGTWSYSATQVAPAAELEGTLTVIRQGGSAFDAILEVQERDALGNVRNRSATISGRTIAGDGIDFDAFMEGSARRHVGRVLGDSISGSWAELDTPPLTGTFRARRVR